MQENVEFNEDAENQPRQRPRRRRWYFRRG